MNKWTPESRAKLSKSLTGRTLSDSHKAAISKNNARIWLGKKLPASVVAQMSVSRKGRTAWNKGLKGAYKMSAENIELMRQRMIGARVGPNNPLWKGGTTPIRTRLWQSAKYRSWREAIFIRDNYTCQMCGAKSGDGVAIRLEADHYPIPFVVYLDAIKSVSGIENLYESAMADTDLWTAPGRTLCFKCHNTTKRGRGTRKTIR